MRHICTLSGGKGSAYAAHLAIKKYGKENIILYFNDTKWEHLDLYRFLKDLSNYFGIPITEDTDGRTPEQLFYDRKALANNRMPFCSGILKGQRLQAYFNDGDNLIFGIGSDEVHRAQRIVALYQTLSAKTGKWPTLEFPLIDTAATTGDIEGWLLETGIEEPELYRLGFSHNNCSGGCVRAGKAYWARLCVLLPDVYADRERVEEEFRAQTGKDVSFFRNETLKQFRLRLQEKGIRAMTFDEEDKRQGECVGICDLVY